jgi:HK97 gp10 family phage protein
MSDTVTCKITGLDELQKQLEAIPRDVAAKLLRKDLREAAEIGRAEMSLLAPKDSGLLSEHFNIKTKVLRQDIAAIAYIGPDATIDYPLPDGTFKRLILNRAGKVKRAIGRISVVTVCRFLEFGTSKMAKRPFMTQAFESTKQKMLDKIIAGIRESLANVSSK